MKRIITSALCMAMACTFVVKAAAQGSPMQPFDPQAAGQATGSQATGSQAVTSQATGSQATGSQAVNQTGQESTSQPRNQTDQPEALKVKTFTLSNGMTVWINEDHSQPTAYGAVVVKAGAKDCPETGIAHYFEHMMFKGTDKIGTIDYAAEKPYLDSIAVKYDELAETTDEEERKAIQMEINRLNIAASDYAIPNEYNNLITQCGGSGLNAYTSMDVTVYHNEFVSSYFEQWAELNSERIMNPVFRLFQSELETVYEEKNRSDNQELSAFSNMILSEGYKGTQYACPVIGTTEYLKNPRLNQMKEFFNKYYVSDNMGLMLTGDIDAESALPILEKTFGRIRRGNPNDTVVPELPEFNGHQTVEALVKIPVIKIEALCFRGPSQKDADCLPLSFMGYLLNNTEGIGLLDKLTTDRKLMAAMCMYPNLAFNEAGVFPILIIPKLFGQSSKKAEKIVLVVLDDLKSGNIDDSFFESCKQSYKRELISSLEMKGNRLDLMVNAFAQGKDWDSIIAEPEIIDKLTKNDIVALANKYFTDNCLAINKKFGDPEKDNLQKPPYKSVIPANRAASSAYAIALLEQAAKIEPPMPVIDYENDACTKAITPNVALYSVNNPFNDIFNLDITYKVGTIAIPELERVSTYLSLVGSSDMDYETHRKALQEIGGSMYISVNETETTISISGFDDKFEQTLDLAAALINSPANDRKSLNIIKENEAMDDIMSKRDASTITSALNSYILYGKDGSPYLEEKGKLNVKSLLETFEKARTYSCDVCYSGTADAEKVAEELTKRFQFEKSVVPFEQYDARTIMLENSPAVYFVDKPKASQSNIYALVAADKLTDLGTRYTSYAYGMYLGGGMGSLLFQEIREFRSLAYSTNAQYVKTNYNRRDIDPTYLSAYVGTQSDKTIEAMEVVDSLISKTPFDAKRIEMLKKEMIFDEITSYPHFRQLPSRVAQMKNVGYETDPTPEFFRTIESLNPETLKAFWSAEIEGKRPVWVIVGDKKKTDMESVAGYGEIHELKVKDIIK